jgi:hypothetical protein
VAAVTDSKQTACKFNRRQKHEKNYVATEGENSVPNHKYSATQNAKPAVTIPTL